MPVKPTPTTPTTALCRCIKPNDTKSAMVFTPELVLAQVRYLGLMENVRVRRAGYAFRQLYGPFLQRYKMLNPRTWPRWDGGDRYGAGMDCEGQGAAVGGVSDQPCLCCGAGRGLRCCWQVWSSPQRSWRLATPRSSSARRAL